LVLADRSRVACRQPNSGTYGFIFGVVIGEGGCLAEIEEARWQSSRDANRICSRRVL